MENAERFLNAYAVIEHELQKILDLKDHRRFYDMVDMAAKVNPVISRYKFDLREYGDLRNAIVHDRADGKIIAVPNDDTVAHIEAIASALVAPPRVVPLFQKKVLTLQTSDPMTQAIRLLSKYTYSQAPVLEQDTIAGLITTSLIVRWMGHSLDEGTFDLENTTVGAILDQLKCMKCFEIVSAATSLYEIPELFLSYQEHGGKLEAVLITRYGSNREPLLGIITNRDLPAVQRHLLGRKA
ncbi:MAG TPA: CBS domain-containing protein [Bacillota bacterium]|nr:CBS domain-containing protein [Bacillota bacterium]